MLEFLPQRLKDAVGKLHEGRLLEVRIRAEKPLYVNLNGCFHPVGENGIVSSPNRAIMPSAKEVEDALYAASGYSIYSVEEQLKQGFLTTAAGERIGIGGTFVYEAGHTHAIRSVTSLCIRIPHEIKDCAKQLYARCMPRELCSVLILSPPGEGKTTLLRDLSRLICEKTNKNVLICDERGELSAGDIGITADQIRFCDKLTAFTAGIRAMRPDVIMTDEMLPHDYAAARRAKEGGVIVIASAHLTRFEDVPEKIFDRYVLLKYPGKLQKVWNEHGIELD